jgi:hypothetical protein
MTKRAILVLALAAGFNSAGFGVPTAGASPDSDFQKRIFGRVLGKERLHACYRRVYDAAHLAGHPEQNTRSMLLLMTAEPYEGSAPGYGIRMRVTFRKSKQPFESYGNCGALGEGAGSNANTAHCGVDCDGGSIDVAIRDANSLLVSIPAGARLWRPGGEDDETGSGKGQFGSDDKVFRVDRAKLTDCLDLALEPADKAAMRRGQ